MLVDGFDIVRYHGLLEQTCSVDDCNNMGITLREGALWCGSHSPQWITPDHAATPIQRDLEETLENARREADLAYGTPAFHALARRYHRIADMLRDVTGVDPRPSAFE